jgi:hypothetical protein
LLFGCRHRNRFKTRLSEQGLVLGRSLAGPGGLAC